MTNVPQMTCDSLKVNLQLAGILGFSGKAARYGAFQAAVDTTQDRTIQALDPRNCSNHASIQEVASVGNGNRDRYGVRIKWETPDCNDYTDDCGAFTCTDGETVTPTTSETIFKIDQCIKMNITIPHTSWVQTCCGVEEYYKQVVEARRKGATGRQIQGLINSLSQNNKEIHDRSYELKLVAEKIGNTLTSRMETLNTYILDKLVAGAGYNFVKDAFTGAVVGDNVWEVPVLELPESGYTAQYFKTINPNALRKELSRFVSAHPNCATGITIIGDHTFREMFESLGVMCCDATGINQAQAISKVTGYLTNFYLDDFIDTHLPAGTFFIVENNSMALFWLAMQTDPARRKETINDGTSGIMREFGTLAIPVSDCRNDGMSMLFDTLLTSKVANCLADKVFNLQLRAEYELFTMPAVGCVNPRTGIYQGLLVDRLQPVVVVPTPV